MHAPGFKVPLSSMLQNQGPTWHWNKSRKRRSSSRILQGELLVHLAVQALATEDDPAGQHVYASDLGRYSPQWAPWPLSGSSWSTHLKVMAVLPCRLPSQYHTSSTSSAPVCCLLPARSLQQGWPLPAAMQVLATEDDLALDWEQSVDEEGHSLMVCGRRSLWAAEHVERAVHIASRLNALDEKMQSMRERDADCEFGCHLSLRYAGWSVGMAGCKAVKLPGRGEYEHILVAGAELVGHMHS